MCGIVGIVSQRDVAGMLVETLRRLEYRGYDSAGIATISQGRLDRRRAPGKLGNLEQLLNAVPLQGSAGIGHTRWATHGAPSERNAHPHMSERVSVVHNGIIENYRDLKIELQALGYQFTSDTDTEAVTHLVTYYLDRGETPISAVAIALKRLKGAFALGMIFSDHNNMMIAARRGSPLAIGYGDGEMYLGSDAIALAPYTDTITYLEDGDWAVVTRDGVSIFDESGHPVIRDVQVESVSTAAVEKSGYRHFMEKEIAEQSDVLMRTLAHYVDFASKTVRADRLPVGLESVGRITISACGTAYYAGQIAKYWFERYARLPVDIDVASEFRYREVPLERNGLAVFVSQSGETADTLASLRYCKAQGQRIAAVVNVQTSTIARESDYLLPTLAGPEIGVASTKAFTCQLAVLAALAIGAGRARGVLDEARERELVDALLGLPGMIAAHLKSSAGNYAAVCKQLAAAKDVLYLGRGSSFPLAMEGALKLKEISYIHAEGYAAGELKHGPIALVDEQVPVIVLAPKDELFEKTVSNLQEVAARGGRIILLSNATTADIGSSIDAMIQMPDVHPFASPILYALPMQLIAYHTAVAIGADVDQPRNLAKSVTVE